MSNRDTIISLVTNNHHVKMGDEHYSYEAEFYIQGEILPNHMALAVWQNQDSFRSIYYFTPFETKSQALDFLTKQLADEHYPEGIVDLIAEDPSKAWLTVATKVVIDKPISFGQHFEDAEVFVN